MLLNCGIGENFESPLDCKEIQPVHPKGDQSWVFIGRTDVEVKTSILWPPHAKSWLIWKDPDAGEDWGQEEKGMTEVGWHHQLSGHGFGSTAGSGGGQGGLACCGSCSHKELDMTEWLNWTDETSLKGLLTSARFEWQPRKAETKKLSLYNIVSIFLLSTIFPQILLTLFLYSQFQTGPRV